MIFFYFSDQLECIFGLVMFIGCLVITRKILIKIKKQLTKHREPLNSPHYLYVTNSPYLGS